MREILFKAKDANSGEWVEGYYAHLNSEAGSRHAIIPENPEILNILMKGNAAYEIDRDTLSQYTGLKDSRGDMVWENDILQCHFDEEFPEDCTIYHVVFSNGEWQIKDNYGRTEKLDSFTCECGEVVGNVFDNPELMGE
jgi:uncharacterized phage protein (TIGR01671 family)